MMDKKKTNIDAIENLLRQGKYQEAIDLGEKIHKANPEEESVLLMLSWAYYDSGNTGQAIKHLNTLFDRELQRKVFTGFAYDELVRIHKQEKNFGKLVEICEKAVAVQPEDVGLLDELGKAYLHAGRTQKACNIFEKLIGIENDNTVYYCNWGEALFAAGRKEASEQAYLKAGEMDPEQADHYYFKIANLFQLTGQHQDAERLFNKCVEIRPDNPLYYCSLGDCLVDRGQIKDAFQSYKTAATKDRAGAGAYYNRLGNALIKAGNVPDAIEAFQAAIAHDSAERYYLNLANAYKAMGLDEQADQIMGKLKK